MRRPQRDHSAPIKPAVQKAALNAAPAALDDTTAALRRIQTRRRKRALPRAGTQGIEFLESRRLMSTVPFPWIFEADLRRNAGTTPVDHLVFTGQPGAIIAGQAFAAPITIDIFTSAGVLDTGSNAAITIAIAGTGHTAGTTTIVATAGEAVFSDFSVTSAGNYKLQVSAEGLSPVASALFAVSPDGASAHLVVTQHPLSEPVGKQFAPAVSVAVKDQFGNVLPGDASAVSLALTSGPRGGSLTGITTLTTRNGLAKFGALSIPLAGTYTLQASDAALPSPLSDPFQLTITQGVTTITAPRTGGAAVFGGTVTLSASLRSTADRSVPFTGTATLLDANNNVLGSVAVDNTGRMKFIVAGLGLGAYECTIAYSGDANHTSRVSAPFPLQITAAPTRVALSSNASAPVVGQDLQLDASVTTRFSPSAPPTGIITFLDRGVAIGDVPVDPSGHATLTIPVSALGSHAFSAVYSGDGEFQFSAAQPRSFNVNKAATFTTLRGPSIGFVAPGELIALTVNVGIRPPAQGQPTGTITFKDGNQIIATVPVGADGSARLTTSLATRGTHRLVAVYSGDGQNNPSASNMFLEFVTS